jgi:DNA-binding CsgD family transcriptional regulator
MSYIQKVKSWQMTASLGPVYERLLAAIGSEEFGSTVREAVLATTSGARRIYLFEASGRENSHLQYYHGEAGLVDLLPAYSKSYHRVDPVCDAYQAAPQLGDVAFLRLRPRDIASHGFRRRFFDDAGIVERVSILQKGGESWRVLNVARHVSDGYFSDDELDRLIGLACLTLPMLPLNRTHAVPAAQLTVDQLERRFAVRFGRLTPRERQVCARAVIGMTVEATAIDLGIAKTSVLTYRQRAYQRLRISGPYELCSLVTH